MTRSPYQLLRILIYFSYWISSIEVSMATYRHATARSEQYDHKDKCWDLRTIVIKRNVDIDNITFFQFPLIRNPMTNNFIYGPIEGK